MYKIQLAMGQHSVPPRAPVNIPIPTKIGPKMGGEFTYPKMGSQNGFDNHSHFTRRGISVLFPSRRGCPLGLGPMMSAPASPKPSASKDPSLPCDPRASGMETKKTPEAKHTVPQKRHAHVEKRSERGKHKGNPFWGGGGLKTSQRETTQKGDCIVSAKLDTPINSRVSSARFSIVAPCAFESWKHVKIAGPSQSLVYV